MKDANISSQILILIVYMRPEIYHIKYAGIRQLVSNIAIIFSFSYVSLLAAYIQETSS